MLTESIPVAPTHDVRVRHRQHPIWRVVTAIVVLLVIGIGWGLIVNPNLEWVVVAKYFFSINIVRGLLLTIELTALSMAIGITIGVIAALMRLSPIPILRWVGWLYVWFFRAAAGPDHLLVQPRCTDPQHHARIARSRPPGQH